MGRFNKLEIHGANDSVRAEPELTPMSGAEPVTGDDLVREAEEFFYTGDCRKAMRYYSRALSIDNTRVDPWSGQVFSLLMLGQASEAQVWSKRALECFPDHPTMLSLNGLAMALHGMVKRGLATSDYALSRGADDRMAWVARGWILLEADNHNWEFCFSKVAEKIPPHEWRLPMLMGMILERYKFWAQAVEQYQTALSRFTTNHYLWYRLGICYSKLGLSGKAMEAQKQSLNLKPGFAPAEHETRNQSGIPLKGLFSRFRSLFRRS